jgi:hypothetical protein
MTGGVKEKSQPFFAQTMVLQNLRFGLFVRF